jgi:hypothetical protein
VIYRGDSGRLTDPLHAPHHGKLIDSGLERNAEQACGLLEHDGRDACREPGHVAVS